ncbi:hypothetical protein P7K49_032612 [Saguinus oedipus]|uniref:EGF-like domain-containing protein n=1 Tax=Saguinus oedipus TaxID=9490 RepID=A0ABQ9TZF1_SAGOE|nr:hypothetical protein P7K49_032612 [Saguinus oedipus]
MPTPCPSRGPDSSFHDSPADIPSPLPAPAAGSLQSSSRIGELRCGLLWLEFPALSVRYYDECERKEDDCLPGTICRNTLGSFTCSCEGGAPDFSVQYSERPCKGDSAGNKSATHPERPLMAAGTNAAFVQGTSPTPQGLPQRLNLTGAVRVLCEIEKVVVAIQKRFLQQESIPESSLYLSHPSCNVSLSNGTHVLLEAGWSECGTVMQSVRLGEPGSGHMLRCRAQDARQGAEGSGRRTYARAQGSGYTLGRRAQDTRSGAGLRMHTRAQRALGRMGLDVGGPGKTLTPRGTQQGGSGQG